MLFVQVCLTCTLKFLSVPSLDLTLPNLSMPFSDLTNTCALSPSFGNASQILLDTEVTMMPPTDATILSLDSDSPLDPMDPRTFLSLTDFSSLNEDYPSAGYIQDFGSNFEWCFQASHLLELQTDGDTTQIEGPALHFAIPDAPESSKGHEDLHEDNDNDNGHDGTIRDTFIADTSHWQHVTPATDGQGTMWAQWNLDHPVIAVQTRRGNASKETRKLQAAQAQAQYKDLANATNVAKHEINMILQRVTDQYGKKINVIKQMAFNQTRHRYQCTISIHDMKISWKMKQEKDSK